MSARSCSWYPMHRKVIGWPVPLLLAALLVLPGCARWDETTGVENSWRSDAAPQWQPGKTSAEEVIAALGPPSQLINLQNQSVYYYMRERVTGNGYFLLFYNTSTKVTRFDRAVFFFDESGVLTRFAYSNDSLPVED